MPEEKKAETPESDDNKSSVAGNIATIMDSASEFAEKATEAIGHIDGRITRIEEALFQMTSGLIESFNEPPECCADEEEVDDEKQSTH